MQDRHAHIALLLNELPSLPGVYTMYGQEGEILYVGKAKNLKNRVSSYFQKNLTSPKTKALVAKIYNFEITITASETEALLLEQTLIKEQKPPYNILLRDDKSYPFIFLSDDEYPRLVFHRGTKKEKGKYFGPFPSSYAVRESLQLLQKLFLLRQCENSFFSNRDRPCLQYQIKRCRAPCVAAISPEEYMVDVNNTRLFLEGKSTEVMAILVAKMNAAAESFNYELAAIYRDQITHLRHIQEQQHVDNTIGDADIFGVCVNNHLVCVQIVFVRDGRVMGSKSYFPEMHGEYEVIPILEEFLPSYYLGAQSEQRGLPQEIILAVELSETEVLTQAIRELHGKSVHIKSRVREQRQAWLDMAQVNAEQSLSAKILAKKKISGRYEHLRQLLDLPQSIKRMECFDISHSSGEATVASCVVFDEQGPQKRDYRLFKIEGITPGDDYAAMLQALTRRYQRVKAQTVPAPDILFIDGGKGQLSQAQSVLSKLAIDDIILIGIAKGEGRKPGLETLHLMDGREIHLASDAPALHLIQSIRDEAHRFAVAGHRAQRSKARQRSVLQDIPNVGPKRRKELIQHFGGLQEVQRASIKDLANVPGISSNLAELIYKTLHDKA